MKTKRAGLLTQLKSRWQRCQAIQCLLYAAATSLVCTGILHKLLDASFYISIPLFGLSYALFWILSRKITEQTIARHLNASFPQLEESSELLLKPENSLTLIENLQLTRLQQRIAQISPSALLPLRWQKPVVWMAAALILTLCIWWMPLPQTEPTSLSKGPGQSTIQKTSALLLAKVTGLHIHIKPPAYTGKAAFSQQTLAIQTQAGSVINWQITLSRPADQIYLMLNDKEKLLCTPLKNSTLMYAASLTVTENGFYQIVVDSKPSDYSTIEAIPDKPPVITISSPEPYTEILFGQGLRKQLSLKITDDHGIREAYIIATVAKGSGEAVKFREEKLPLPVKFKAFQKQATAEKQLDLTQFGMAPGDELYFYVEALDNHGLSARTDMYFINLEDTANVATVADLSMGINPVPEYFRSQRQIIIDTEKLIKQRTALSQAQFNDQSNTIGVDQKILRLRYGKFLGEEFENQIGELAGKEEMEKEGIETEGHYAGDGHDHSKDGALLESFMHLHDQSEEATFFEPALKAQLKAALAQMWEAELRLRTHRPKEALPFEYKALRLLKEVQQKSRAYVNKTGYEPPPLKPAELRLTGELDKIQEASLQQEMEFSTVFPNIRQSLPLLQKLKKGDRLSGEQRIILERAGSEMGQAAIAQPGRYLQALSALKQLVTELESDQPSICQACVAPVEKAFWQLLPPAEKIPEVGQSKPAKLADTYFEYLQPVND